MRTATTNVALQCLLDLGLGGTRVLLQESDTAHDHAGSAVGTLEGFGLEEGLLNEMEAARLFEAFDGGNGFSRGSGNQSDAGATRRAVQQNRAGAALSLAATVFGAREAEL